MDCERELARQICEAHEVNIFSGVVSADHARLYVSIPRELTPSKLAMRLKGRTSRRIQEEFPELKKRCWGQHFCARGYFCVSAGNITDDMIREYLATHSEKPAPDIEVESSL